ncbi:SDR family NAD(P)-dependent oxidoreductase [Mariniluteicoccus flavus]
MSDERFDLHGTALVTGATGGLGAAYAEFLARSGLDVVLTARRTDVLEDLAARLRERHNRAVTVVPADLTDRAARAKLAADLAARGVAIDVLVNNAGFGTHGEFTSTDPDRALDEVELNVAAVTHLARLFLPGMRERHYGVVINVASTAAFQPIPSMAVYAATKAYVLSFSQALWSENLDHGVRVIAVCPGPTETEFWVKTGEPDAMQRRRTPDQVVLSTFRALARHEPRVIDGAANEVLAQANRLVPVRVALPLARAFAKPRKRD